MLPHPTLTGDVPGDVTETLYAAIGQAVGFLGPTTLSDEPAAWIRRGSVLHAATFSTYRLWAALRVPQTLEAVRMALPEIHDTFDDDWAALADIALIVPLPQTGDDLFWEQIRIVPQGVGVGQERDDPENWAIMVGRAVAVHLCLGDYMIWATLNGHDQLLHCLFLASQTLDVPLSTLQERIPRLIPALLTAGVAYLDMVGVTAWDIAETPRDGPDSGPTPSRRAGQACASS